MAVTPALFDKFKAVVKPAVLVYPLVVIIAIPLLLAINTIWNLRSFNRDVNFAIRHQAVSIADTLKPIIAQNLENEEELNSLLQSITQANSDIVSATILRSEGNKVEVVTTTQDTEEAEAAGQIALNQLAIALDQPFAGLSYDPKLAKNVWNVVVPVTSEGPSPYLLALKIKTDTVDEILKRTSRDSFIILSVLIIVTLILLANHFIFYRKAQEARQLAKLDKLKDEFISMASHELRAPVTALTGYLELLRDKITSAGFTTLKPEMDTLKIVTNDLKNLINDLLEVSRIEQGRMTLTLTDIQINDVIVKAIETMKPLADNKSLAIKFAPGQLPVIKTDPDRLRQVVTNLVSNSIKYTLEGEISISSKVKAKFIEVTVRDTGTGIPPDELPKLFSKFHRVKDKKTEEVRGTGLGLWITKQIVETLGGKIYAESIYGTGSVFTFTLPITA